MCLCPTRCMGVGAHLSPATRPDLLTHLPNEGDQVGDFTGFHIHQVIWIFIQLCKHQPSPPREDKDSRSRGNLDTIPDESQQSRSRFHRTLPSLLQQVIVPQGTPTKQGLIPIYRHPYRTAIIPHVKCFLLVEGQQVNDRPGEGCFRSDRSYERSSIMGPHRLDLVELHLPAWTPVAADGPYYSPVLCERNWENSCLRSSAIGLLWPSYTIREASHTLRIHPRCWHGPGQSPRTHNKTLQSASLCMEKSNK